MKKLPTTPRIALLFNANKIYERGIITGNGNYLSSTRASWGLFLEEDFHFRLSGSERWNGAGIITDFDDPAARTAMANSPIPVFAVGGSYENTSDYLHDIAYVATDNFKLIKLAYDHLTEAGLTRFACFRLPEAPVNRWPQKREQAFYRLMQALYSIRQYPSRVLKLNRLRITAAYHAHHWKRISGVNSDTVSMMKFFDSNSMRPRIY